MHLIVLQGPEGIRKVPELTPYRLKPGEQIIGTTADPVETELQSALYTYQIPLGDFIEKAIKLIPAPIRPRHCSSCEKRKLVLNKVRELGVVETLRQVREIE